MEQNVFIIEENEAGLRLDVFIVRKLPGLSRSQVQRLIEDEMVLVNENTAKANMKIKMGDEISCTIPKPEPLAIEPEDIPLDIIYEDSDLIVVNKPQGMVVHPANGNYHGTMVNALLFHCRDLSGINGVLRPGIVHRIDKDTSGLLVVAKNDMAHLHLANQLKEHTMERKYLALVHGVVTEPGGLIDAPIGRDTRDRQKMAVALKNSKDAVTQYCVLERYVNYTLVECKLETGRTHQIRVHMAYIKHPVVGDPKYGPKKAHLGLTGQALHAQTLGFIHPRTEEKMMFSVKPPKKYQEVLSELGSSLKFDEEGEVN